LPKPRSRKTLSIPFGDPHVLKDDNGKYYIYGTGGDVKNRFGAYSLVNLKDWKFEGQVYRHDNPNGWGISFF